MCETVGYDVNNSNNGLSLPTCGQKDLNSYSTSTGTTTNYGNLDETDKINAAFQIMAGLSMQFHVGHHNWSMDFETDPDDHDQNYDDLVKTKLRALERDAEREGESICEPEDDSESGRALIAELNALSQEIKIGVIAWKVYFVSAMSYRYAEKYKR